MYKTRVRSDRYEQHKKHMTDMMEIPMMDEERVIPVDLYGKRVFRSKEDGSVARAGEDIREFYDLMGDAGLS